MEEIYINQYQDLEDLRSHVQEFIEQYYHRSRLHSALDYRSPEKFEQQLYAGRAVSASAAAVLSFSGHGAIYQCNGEQPEKPLPDSLP